jgi:NTP pyrophosphatase (non-canonical NTP hydrolase)
MANNDATIDLMREVSALRSELSAVTKDRDAALANIDTAAFLQEDACRIIREVAGALPDYRDAPANVAAHVAAFAAERDAAVRELNIIRAAQSFSLVCPRWAERELRANDHKGTWRDCKLGYLTKRLDEEVQELHESVRAGHVVAVIDNHDAFDTIGVWSAEDAAKVLEEAADVANFAMMIADVVRTRVKVKP